MNIVHRLSRQTYKTDKSRYGATILCGNRVPEVSSDSKLSQPIHDGLIDFDVLPRFSNVRALPARARGSNALGISATMGQSPPLDRIGDEAMVENCIGLRAVKRRKAC
jgi:hypothetical protein